MRKKIEWELLEKAVNVATIYICAFFEKCVKSVDLLMCLSCHWLHTASSTGIVITSHLPWKSLNWLQGGHHWASLYLCVSIDKCVHQHFNEGVKGKWRGWSSLIPQQTQKFTEGRIGESDQNWPTSSLNLLSARLDVHNSGHFNRALSCRRPSLRKVEVKHQLFN